MPGGTAFAAESVWGSSGAWLPLPPKPASAAAAAPPAPPAAPAAPPRPPPPPPRAALAGLRSDGTFGSAPYFTSKRMASTSTAYAARQNGVVPSMFSRPQLPLPQLLYTKYHICETMRVLGLAPALSSAFITSMYVAFWNSCCCGCGKRECGDHAVLMVAYSGVRPLVAAMLTLAPYLMSSSATSN